MRALLVTLTLALAATPAAASDFNGRIKKVRVKESSSGSNIYAITVVGGSESPEVKPEAEKDLELALSAADGRLRSLVPDAPTGVRRQVTLAGTWPGTRASSYTVKGSVPVGREVVGFVATLPACARDCAWIDTKASDGTALRLRAVTHPAGRNPEVTVELEHVGADAKGIARVQQGGAYTLTLADARSSLTLAAGAEADTFLTHWDAVVKDVAWATLATVTLRRPDGTADKVEQPLFLGARPGTAATAVAVAPQGRDGRRLTVTTWAEAGDDVEAVSAEVGDAASFADVAARVTTTADSTVALLTTQGTSFAGAAKDAGYALAVTLLAGDVVVGTSTGEVGLRPDVVFGAFARDGATGVRKLVAEPSPDGTWGFALSVDGPEADVVDRVEVTLTPLGAAPAPKLATLGGDLDGRWQTWVLPFRDPASGAVRYDVRVDVEGVGGVALDGIDWEVEANLGTGTRTTTGQASNKAELL